MNQQTVTYNDTHAGWKQRVQRELGAQKLYASKGYQNGANGHGTQSFDARVSGSKSVGKLKRLQTAGFNRTQDSNWLNTSTNPNGQLLSSYPIPFKRINNNQRALKQTLGYLNDSTATNPSNPSTMVDQGIVRNAVYNMTFNGQEYPKIGDWNYSKALNTHDQGFLNNSFYSFGAQHTNINEAMFDNQTPKSGSKKHSRSTVLNRTLQDVKVLNSIKEANKEKDIILMNKVPNVVMNDYTKNISQSIFTPGIIPQKQPLHQSVKLNSLFGSTGQKDRKLLYYEDEKKGLKGQVFGKIGSKTMQFSDKPRAGGSRTNYNSKSQSDIRFVKRDQRIDYVDGGIINATGESKRHNNNRPDAVRTMTKEQILKLKNKYNDQVRKRKTLEDDVRSLKSTMTSIRDNLRK